MAGEGLPQRDSACPAIGFPQAVERTLYSVVGETRLDDRVNLQLLTSSLPTFKTARLWLWC